MQGDQWSLRKNVQLFTVFIHTELRIFYCENVEMTTGRGALSVKYLLERTGDVSNASGRT